MTIFPRQGGGDLCLPVVFMMATQKKKIDNFFAIKGRCFLKNPFYDSLAHNLGRKKRIFAPKKKTLVGTWNKSAKPLSRAVLPWRCTPRS
jgi:hypothetical protein